MSKNHLQGKWTQHEGRWVIAIPAGQQRSPRIGDEVTIHKASGELQRYTLTTKLGHREWNKKITYLFDGVQGWGLPAFSEVVESDSAVAQ